jgi:PBSX family phage terminase large subunit
MKLTAKQREIVLYNRHHRPKITILEGAVRSGKTYINNLLWLKHVSEFQGWGVKFIMTGSTIASLKRNVLDDIEVLTGIDTRLNKNNEFRMFGNTVACFGADKADSYKPMKGFTAFGWYGNEVTENHFNSVDQAIKRCSHPLARMFWDTNPSFPDHHIKRNFIDKSGETVEGGREYVKSWHFVLDDNEFLSNEYKDALKKSIPSGMFYDRDILGLWVAAEGIIFKDFNHGVHVIDKAPEGLKEYIAGVDWGYDHFGVIGVYGIDHDGNIFRLYEIAEREKGIDFWIAQAKEIRGRHGDIPFYADSARPDYIADFRRAGLRAMGADKEVIEGIAFVAGLFKRNKLYIIRGGNKLLLNQIYNYRWREGGAVEAPIKEDDDALDEMRYALYSHFGKDRSLKPSAIAAGKLGL